MPRYWFRQKRFGYGATPNTGRAGFHRSPARLALLRVIVAADFQRDDATRFLLIGIGLPLIVVPTVLITRMQRPKAAGAGVGAQKISMTEPVFKIVPRAEWAEVTDAYEGSAHDRADGFLHFSTWPQLPETLRRYYAGKDDLLAGRRRSGAIGQPAEMGTFPFARRGFSPSLWRAAYQRGSLGEADRKRRRGQFPSSRRDRCHARGLSSHA